MLVPRLALLRSLPAGAGLATILHLGGCGGEEPNAPAGYMSACESDTDCPDGLQCAVFPPGLDYSSACTLPCTTNEECPSNESACPADATCDGGVCYDPAYCE
jgi:hypothetical protein